MCAVHPPTAVTVRATRDGDGPDPATGETTVKASIDKHARATVVVAPDYPEPPQPQATAVHGEIACPCTPETLYEERHLFHGPAYQGLLTFDEFGEDGASGLLETKDFPGSLLDNAGQLFGFWLAQRVDKDRLVLPTSIDRISFYGPHLTAGTVVRCVVNATEIGEVVVRADLELTVDGVVWCRIEGWEDRRFQSDDRLFTLLRKPHDRTLAEPQDGGWVLVTEGWPDSASRDVVMRRFLGVDERSDYDARNPNVQRTWLLGRIAAKDAVRDLLWRTGTQGRIFPVEVTVSNDDDGAPHATAPDGSDVRISIAHTAGLGVAMAAHGVDVGIDIERIEDRPDSFELAALSKKERARFEALPDIARQSVRDVELTRWWAAKEAAAKAAGTGMQGRPKDWKVVEVDGWQTRGKEPKDWLCQVFHHTASNRRAGNAPSLGICTNGRGGSAPVPGPLCNAVVGRDGTWHVIASGAANHPGVSTIPHHGGISSGVKYYALGWECENDGIGEPWPRSQLASIETGEAAVADHLGWRLDTSEVFGHKEIARPKGRKIDPAGIDMDDHRRRVGARRPGVARQPGLQHRGEPLGTAGRLHRSGIQAGDCRWVPGA